MNNIIWLASYPKSKMTDCVIVQPIARLGVDLLERTGLSVFEAPAPDLPVLMPHLATARAVITRNSGFSAEAIDAARNLKIIASHGTGTDSIDKAAAERRGIRVVSTPGSNAQSVKHFADLGAAAMYHNRMNSGLL